MTSKTSGEVRTSAMYGKGKLTTLAEKMNSLSESRRNAIDERARILIAEEMSLRAMRKARKLTQATIAEELGVNQENVSRLERRSDFLISSLRNYVEAMGGELRLVVNFPDYGSVALTEISAFEDSQPDPKTDTAISAGLNEADAVSEIEGIGAAYPGPAWNTEEYSSDIAEMNSILEFHRSLDSDPNAYKEFIEEAARAFCTFLSDSSDYPSEMALTFLDREKDKEDVEQAVGRIMTVMARSASDAFQTVQEDSAD